MSEATAQSADYERPMSPEDHARMNLFFDFNDAMTRLWKKYGVIEVQEQARSWVDFIDTTRAHIDGSECDAG